MSLAVLTVSSGAVWDRLVEGLVSLARDKQRQPVISRGHHAPVPFAARETRSRGRCLSAFPGPDLVLSSTPLVQDDSEVCSALPVPPSTWGLSCKQAVGPLNAAPIRYCCLPSSSNIRVRVS